MARAREPDPVEWVRARWGEQELPEPDRFMAVASLMRVHQVVVGELDRALRPFELSRTAYLVLATLALSDDGARKLSYLSRYLMVHQTTITLLIDNLELRGLVKRRPHPTDRRTTLAVLSAKGRKLTQRATAAAAAVGFGLGDAEPGDLTGALRDVRRALGDLPE
ncbi:MAG: hypothetical protein QOF76_441 [Solirubrobacteraceae bacterium]|nr:hypothetical protein [Solirubrobacteraceae bacterium]